MNLLQAILLGVIQGLTEFIPISSTAHLILTQKLMGLDHVLTPAQITAFVAVIQLGTLAAVLAYFSGDLLVMASAFVRANFSRTARSEPETRGAARLGWLIIIGSVPVAVVGLAAKEIIEGRLTKNLYVIAASMIAWAVFLLIAEMVGSRTKALRDLGVTDAMVVGVAQVFALIPGSSRSGTTITGAMLMGATRDVAARFSFLLSIPAVAASGLVEFKQAIRFLDGVGFLNLTVATLASGLVGYASITFLLRYLRRHTTYVFVAYRLIVGAVILALVISRAVTP